MTTWNFWGNSKAEGRSHGSIPCEVAGNDELKFYSRRLGERLGWRILIMGRIDQ
jgi:hypothetical protein